MRSSRGYFLHLLEAQMHVDELLRIVMRAQKAKHGGLLLAYMRRQGSHHSVEGGLKRRVVYRQMIDLAK